MTTKEELNAIKEEHDDVKDNLAELIDEELEQVTGGASIKVLDTAIQKSLDQEAYIGTSRNRLDYI